MTSRSRSVAVLVAAAVVMGTVVGGVAVVGAQDGSGDVVGTNATNGDLPPADEVYIKDDGDAVLAYENHSADSSLRRATLGVNVSEGLFHTLVVGDLDETSNTTGNATAILTPGEFVGNGSLSTPRPEALSNLSVNVSGERTSANARFDATAAATVTAGDANDGFGTLPVKTARTAGNVTVGSSNFSAAAEAHARLSSPLGGAQHQAFHIAEQGNTYTLDAAQEYVVSSFAAQRWNTRRGAERTLRQQYVTLAEQLGGSADLTLESYSFTEQRGGSRLDVEYTVTYRGIERALTNQLVTRLTSAEAVDLNQSEADAIGQRLRNLTVNEASVRYDQRPRSVDASMALDLGNYDGAVLAALDAAESVDTESLDAGAGFESDLNDSSTRFRDRFEARRTANLTNRYAFAANLTKRSDRAVGFDVELRSRTDNWSQYVQELHDRNVSTSDVLYDLRVATEGERVDATASVNVSGENLLRGVSNQVLNTTSESGTSGPDARKYVTAFREAGFRKARTDLSIRGDRVRVEAGAAFRNMSALRDAVATTDQARGFEGLVTRTENDTVTSYARVEGAVPGNATESDVSDLGYVTDDTTVHMPGSWDRSFPTMNTTRANEYLGLTGETSGLVGPGFGVVGAVLALLAAAFVVARRRT